MSQELTDLLQRWRAGDKTAERQAFDEIYPILRALARKQLAQPGAYTLQPTDLAHEAYLKLAEQQRMEWQDRGHFLAIAARIVRRVVVDYLRERQALKRGSGEPKLSLDMLSDSDAPAAADSFDWLRLDKILEELEFFDPDGARLVELRYFTGLSVPAIAKAQEVSESTIARQWRATRAWLEFRLADARE